MAPEGVVFIGGGGASGGTGMTPKGRGAILEGVSSLSKRGVSDGLTHYYKPVSVDGSPDAPPAIPGECEVHPSWKYTSNAPVAYQMQQMRRALESDTEEQECPGSGDNKGKAPSPPPPPPPPPHTTSWLPDKVGHNVQEGDKSKGKEEGALLWEPHFADDYMPPNVTSFDEFPQLKSNVPPKGNFK